MKFSKEINIYAPDAILKRFKANETSFSVVKGKIESLISESEIIELQNGHTTMYSKMSNITQTVDGLTQSYSDISSKYNDVSGQYKDLSEKTAEYKTEVGGLSADITAVTEKLRDNYSTTETMNSSIAASANSVLTTVSKTYATRDRVGNLESWKTQAEQKITADAIVSTVTASNKWGEKADKASLISQINQTAESVAISANKISLEGVVTANDYFKINADGSMEVAHGKIGGWDIQDNALSANDITLSAADGYLQFGSGKNSVMRQDAEGTLYYTEYTDKDNYSGLRFGRTGIQPYYTNKGVQELWLNTIDVSNSFILKYTNNKVTLNANRINSDTVYTKQCTFGDNIATKGTLSVDGKTGLHGDAYVAGVFTFLDYKEELQQTNTRRRPVASASTNSSRVAYLQSAVKSNKLALTVCAQWGSSNYTARDIYNDSASDIRLKDKIRKSRVDAIEAINKMNVVEFQWRDTGIQQPLGLIADDIEKVDKLLVLGGGYNEDGSMNIKQIDRLLLTEYAIKAIQELSEIIQKQDKQIKYLEQEVS